MATLRSDDCSRVQSLHEKAPCDEEPGPEWNQLGFPNPARVVDGELPQPRADLTGRGKDVRLEVEALGRESEPLETVFAERPHPRADVADRESEQECGEAAQRLVRGREQAHDASGPDIARSQVPTRLAIVDERSGTPEDPASVRTRAKGRSRPGHWKRFEERPTEPWTARRGPGPTFLDALDNPECHLRSPDPVGRRGSRGVRFGP